MKKTLALLSFALLLYACGSKKTETDSTDATAMAGEFPNAAILFNILGAANIGLRNLDGAVASFSKAVQIRPGFAPAHNNLGVALKDQGRLPEAVASFSKAVQIKPDRIVASYPTADPNPLGHRNRRAGRSILLPQTLVH